MSEKQSTEKNRYFLGIDQVRRFLPHAYPFLLVDRVLEIHPVGNLSNPSSSEDKIGTRVVAQKNITFNEPHFQGHFPAFSIMPGVLILEAMAQTTSFSLYPAMERDIDRLSRDFQCILLGVDKARFRRPIVPGDVLHLDSVVTKARGSMWGFHVKALIDNKVVAEADLLANLLLKSEKSV